MVEKQLNNIQKRPRKVDDEVDADWSLIVVVVVVVVVMAAKIAPNNITPKAAILNGSNTFPNKK